MFGTTLLIITVIAHPEEEDEGDSGRFKEKQLQKYKMALFWIIFNASASFYNFVGLNIERMSAVRWPTNYNDQVTPKTRCYILLSWLLAFIPALPFLFDTTLEDCAKCCPACWMAVDNHFLMWWTSTTGGIIPSLIILIAVIVVFRSLKNNMGDNARHVCNTMIFISVCFLISVIPITSLMIYSQFNRPTTSKWMGLGFLFSSLNSFTNPLTIMYNSRAFKEAIGNICPALGNN